MLKKPMLKKPTEKMPMLPTAPKEMSPIEKKPMPSPLEQLITPTLAEPAEKSNRHDHTRGLGVPSAMPI